MVRRIVFAQDALPQISQLSLTAQVAGAACNGVKHASKNLDQSCQR